jgi:cytochrome c oxidase assembly protein subunit 19
LRRQNPPGKNNEECRLLAKEYLGCRMEKGLMAKDEWSNLGFTLRQGEADRTAEKSTNAVDDKQKG